MHPRVLLTLVALALCTSFVLAQDKANRIKKVKPADPTGDAPADRFKIILPPKLDKTNKLTPVVFALHGHGGTPDSMEQMWKEPCALMNAILIVGHGGGRVGSGYSWSGYEDAGKVIDAARRALRKTIRLDNSAPRVLTGFSQGAWATYSLGLRYPKTYRRLIPMAGMFRAKTSEITAPLSEAEKTGMKRWRIFIMAGIKDKQELVSNNHWLVGQLEMLGTSVCAPFMTKSDPSFDMYQDMGHSLPNVEHDVLVKEFLRALAFVLQPDDLDRANWSKVDPNWESKARWMKTTSDKSTPAKKKKVD